MGKNISGDVHVDNLRRGGKKKKKLKNVCVKIYEMKDVKKRKYRVRVNFKGKEINVMNEMREKKKMCLNIQKETTTGT